MERRPSIEELVQNNELHTMRAEELFHDLDTNKNGTLDLSELRVAIRGLHERTSVYKLEYKRTSS